MDLNQTIAAYQAQIRGIARNRQITNLDEFQDGRVTRNLLEQGHLPENISQAITKFSPVAMRQAAQEKPVLPEEYATNLINKGQIVISAMNEIKEFDVSKFAGAKLDSFSEYKYLVQQHIQEKERFDLNSTLDADVAFKMFQRGHSRTDTEDAILKMSPVAQEAGRSPGEYSEYVIGKTVENWEKYQERQKIVETNYLSAAQEYLNMKEARKALLEEGRSEAYQDGRIVRELINKGHSRDSLVKVVAENAADKEGRTRDGYAKYIVNGVIDEIRAEQKIRSFEINSIEKDTPPTLEQIYLQRTQKLFERSPDESFNSFIDVRVAISLVKEGFDRGEIQEIISNLSPAGKRPGITLDYPVKVFEKVDERIAYEQVLDKRYSDVALDYMRNAEQLKNANPGRDYSDYMDGKIAARLLVKGHDKENVQKIIGELSMVARKLQEERGWDTERYGRTIVNRTIQSIERYEAAKAIEPKENPEIKASTVMEEYQHHLKTYIDNHTNLNANTDIQISKKLTAQGYTQAEITQAIQQASPVAIEAGRNALNYADYVQGRTAMALQKEEASMARKETGLNNAKSQRVEELQNTASQINEPGKKLTVAENYKVEVAKLIIQENGWTGPEADVKITQSLLLQGYEKGKISAVINKQSPEIIGKTQEEAKKYANEITKKALTPEIKKQMPEPEKGMTR